MEMVIPPRDHGPSTYRYTWDENGEVEQVTSTTTTNRVRPDSRTLSSTERLPPGHRRRQSAQWPFQSIITDTEEPASPSSPSHHHRRTTATSQRYSAWHPSLLQQLHPLASNPYIPTPTHDPESRPRPRPRSGSGAIIPPEYVRTLLHSTSPESLSRRVHDASSRSRTATPHLVAGAANARHRSRVADFEGFQVQIRDEDPDGEGVFSEMDLGIMERVDSREGGVVHGVDVDGREEEHQRFLKAAA
ncbi:hypothetical protein C8A01DRAFT_34139, partial [Parachaetomium inaequale]